MELIALTQADMVRFVKTVYRQVPVFKDNKTSLYPLLSSKSSFGRNCVLQAMGVQQDGVLQCQALFTRHRHNSSQLVLSFFEALPNAHQAVDFLFSEAKRVGAQLGCTTLVAGLDGHCNYSLGFLASDYNKAPSFGQSYHPAYYHEYFTKWIRIPLSSYWQEIDALNPLWFEKIRRRKESGIHFEYADFSSAGRRATIERYTDLSNRIFTNHRYCYFREHEEDYELFSSMFPLLRSENMIFAVHNGMTVGFLFWYPDYNELVPCRTGAGISTFLQYKLLGQTPATLKVVEIGVLPEYKKTGLIIDLFGELYRIRARNYPTITRAASSWILCENTDSIDMSRHIFPHHDKDFLAYETVI